MFARAAACGRIARQRRVCRRRVALDRAWYELDAVVVAHERTERGDLEIVLQAPQIAASAQPGQFIAFVAAPGYSAAARRPFSLYRVDRRTGTCSVLYQPRGSFTTSLSQTPVGAVAHIIGPLGRPFTWSPDPSARHILIAGGRGAPPLYFLASEICSNAAPPGAAPGRVSVINAARTQELLVGVVEFCGLDLTLRTITDDGSHGARGIATDALAALLDELAVASAPVSNGVYLYSCGPMPMLRAVADLAGARGLPCQVSIETAMPCGVGECGECAVLLREAATGATRNALACWDGPVFEASALDWSGFAAP